MLAFGGSHKPPLPEGLLDREAVCSALEHNEFFKAGEVPKAYRLLVHGTERYDFWPRVKFPPQEL